MAYRRAGTLSGIEAGRRLAREIAAVASRPDCRLTVVAGATLDRPRERAATIRQRAEPRDGARIVPAAAASRVRVESMRIEH